MARGIGSPEPGPIGLDSKGGSAKQSQPSMADQIVSYARRKRGERVGDGECYTLVNRALSAADAKSARDYGTVSPDADYVWGTSVTLTDLQPGDVIQFRDYTFKRVDVTDDDSGTTTDELRETARTTPPSSRAWTATARSRCWEQNAPDGSAGDTHATVLHVQNDHERQPHDDDHREGTFWFYRPEAR